MLRSSLLSSLAAVAIASSAASSALAATPPSNSKAGVQLLRPLTIQKIADMEFGWITATGAGTIVIDPVTNGVTTTGGVLRIGGTAHPAQFTGAASGGSVVIIKLPKQPVPLTRLGGTETMMLGNFTLDGPDKRSMAQATSFSFRVGGTLDVAANQADGDYEGTFEVTVQYP